MSHSLNTTSSQKSTGPKKQCHRHHLRHYRHRHSITRSHNCHNLVAFMFLILCGFALCRVRPPCSEGPDLSRPSPPALPVPLFRFPFSVVSFLPPLPLPNAPSLTCGSSGKSAKGSSDSMTIDFLNSSWHCTTQVDWQLALPDCTGDGCTGAEGLPLAWQHDIVLQYMAWYNGNYVLRSLNLWNLEFGAFASSPYCCKLKTVDCTLWNLEWLSAFGCFWKQSVR